MPRPSWKHGKALLFLFVAALPIQISASPPIRVDLQASFPSAPYLIELLETAADEKPDIYFPILDRIAEGYFDSSFTDRELYDRFLELLHKDELITNPESLSSLKFALAIRNSAPRIEAHYHYYNSSVKPSLGDNDCDVWIDLGGKQYCDPLLQNEVASVKFNGKNTLPFDRILGEESNAVPATLYADISAPEFRRFHQIASVSAKNGKSLYRIRYKPSTEERRPLHVSGYGVELALKRTDYIVIDDRQTSEGSEAQKTDTKQAKLDDEEIDDLKPLSASELAGLSVKAAGFVAGSEDPLESLLKLTQDFPKHSSSLARQNVSDEFMEEHARNREMFLPAGFNVIWINGVQYDPRKVDAFSMLDHLKREKRLIDDFRNMGLTSAESIKLLSHPAIIEAYQKTSSQRYDWRDEREGGNVILWLNDITKDKRYKDWPDDVYTYIQRTFPGQIPSVRRDAFTAIVPVDLSNPKNARLIVQTISSIIKRKVPIRWGIVPVTISRESEGQAKLLYHLQDAYGLVALMEYLEEGLTRKEITIKPHEDSFNAIIEKRSLKFEKVKLTFNELTENEDLQKRISDGKQYLQRLGANSKDAPVFINGVPVKHDDDWLSVMSTQISQDLRTIQQNVFEDKIDDKVHLPELFLNGSLPRRQPLIVPENDKDVTLLNLPSVLVEDLDKAVNLPRIHTSTKSKMGENSQLLLVGDFGSTNGLKLAANAARLSVENENVEVVYIHNPAPSSNQVIATAMLEGSYALKDLRLKAEDFASSLEMLASNTEESIEGGTSSREWPDLRRFTERLQLSPGQTAILLNGRKIGPLPVDLELTIDDLNMLVEYEGKKRNEPATQAIAEVGLQDKIKSVGDFAKVRSLLAVSQVSEVPEGIFETPPLLRTALFYDWEDKHTTFSVGDNSTAAIQVVVSLDPASEAAQRWTPLLRSLTKLEGVFLKVFLNPKMRLEELPVKRFYRYVLGHEPSFNEDGSVKGGAAEFTGLPPKALLTMAMDMPASWLVTSKESVHDLDNIKLSSLEGVDRVDATYELEYILVEGHSRDVTTEAPPSGVQLVLSTDENPRVSDTIIMSNLGYFQFKANPGHYNINLKEGPSRDIYNIDSVGALGYEAHAGDESTDVTLLSFQGVTLYPRLSRKPGQEEEHVLDVESNKAAELVKQGASLVSNLLKKAGFRKDTRSGHADINIFSVASGHLYERMLNIMMVSVMRHTKHTVKFWFIEQFLSPSFKEFLPTMAKEYGFQYEMVTYKWPHWLRAQKEKQREIWGYKILFLDVLFPLDLDKVIFVDADQIVRTDMMELNNVDLQGAPYGFTPMCDSRTEMEGFRFWKQGYWKNFLRGLPYHISALYVVDLKRFRQLAAGDRLRQQYHQLSADPGSLSNLDQDLPNNMQNMIPIHSLDQNWLWCETWCSDESLKDAKTIDLCNNPQTKEPKLERARRQVPEWTEYDDEIAALARRTQEGAQIPLGQVQEDELTEKNRPDVKDEL